jgi:GntR family transcriptional regulator / MocR family aminotransferase
VAVCGLGDYCFGGDEYAAAHAPGLVLGFGNLNESRIRRGVQILAEAIRET